MVHVTLVGLKQAKKDMVFVFKGPLLECRECKYKQVCFNLEEGKRYKVTALRDATHECGIHEGGVRAVEVEVIPFEGAISGRMVLEGSIVPLDTRAASTEDARISGSATRPIKRSATSSRSSKSWVRLNAQRTEK